MKNLKSLAFLGSIILILFSACEKDTIISDPIIGTGNGNNFPTSNVMNFFDNNLTDAIITHNATASSVTQTFTGSKGYTFTFGPNTFSDCNGNSVTGNFQIEYVEATTKNEMLKINRPTFTNNGELLESGGIVYLNVTQNGQQLCINDAEPVAITIPTQNFTPMQYFVGSSDANNNFGWDLDDTENVTLGEAPDSTNFEQNTFLIYEFEMDSIGWINCDFFYNSANPLTGVEVILPDTFNGGNSLVFIFYETINAVANLHDYDEDGTFDLGSGYSTPEGMDVTFIIVSELDGLFYYNLTASTITNNHSEVISSLTAIDETALELILDNL
jgi:hypothetical protein